MRQRVKGEDKMALFECECSRVVRLELSQGPVWICNQCNAQYVPKLAVEYKLDHLRGELRLLGGIRVMAEQLFEKLEELAAICPGDDEEVWSLIRRYREWRGLNEQGSGVREQEDLSGS